MCLKILTATPRFKKEQEKKNRGTASSLGSSGWALLLSANPTGYPPAASPRSCAVSGTGELSGRPAGDPPKPVKDREPSRRRPDARGNGGAGCGTSGHEGRGGGTSRCSLSSERGCARPRRWTRGGSVWKEGGPEEGVPCSHGAGTRGAGNGGRALGRARGAGARSDPRRPRLPGSRIQGAPSARRDMGARGWGN